MIMTDELYNFANELNNKNYEKFIKAGFHCSDFVEASICMVLKSLVAMQLTNRGIKNPNDEQLLEFTLIACDDLIEWCNTYKDNLMCEEE